MTNFSASLYGDQGISRAHATRVFNDVSLVNAITSEMVKQTKCQENCESNLKFLSLACNNVFHLFNYEHKSIKFFKDSNCYTSPLIKTVKVIMSTKRIHKKRVLIPTLKKLTIILIHEVLKKFFELPNVFNIIQTYVEMCKNSVSDEITSPLQSEVWIKIQKTFGDKTVYPLLMSADDLEINNPLGSHRGVQKLGCVYIYLPCLPREYRGTLDNIFLTQLHRSNDFKKYLRS